MVWTMANSCSIAAWTSGSSTPCSARNTIVPWDAGADWPPNSFVEDVEAAGALEAGRRRSPGRSSRRRALETPPTTMTATTHRTATTPPLAEAPRTKASEHAETSGGKGCGRAARSSADDQGSIYGDGVDGAIGDHPGCDGCHQGFSSRSLGFRPHDPGPLPPRRPGRHRHRRGPRHRRRLRASRSPRPAPTSCCRRARRSSSTRSRPRSRRVGRRAVVVPADLSDLDAVAGLADDRRAGARADRHRRQQRRRHDAPAVPRHVARAADPRSSPGTWPPPTPSPGRRCRSCSRAAAARSSASRR